MSAHGHARAVGGEVLDPLMKVLLAIFAVSAVFMAYRFYAGVGAVSNIDCYPWGTGGARAPHQPARRWPP